MIEVDGGKDRVQVEPLDAEEDTGGVSTYGRGTVISSTEAPPLPAPLDEDNPWA
jgi:hypothetical protein